MKTTNMMLVIIVSLVLCGTSFAASKPDRFYVPQPEQAFDGKVKTRIGKLKFKNQYPSKESMESILDNMDFHGATQAYLWGIPIASFANLQHYIGQRLEVSAGRTGQVHESRTETWNSHRQCHDTLYRSDGEPC